MDNRRFETEKTHNMLFSSINKGIDDYENKQINKVNSALVKHRVLSFYIAYLSWLALRATATRSRKYTGLTGFNI